MIKALGVEIEGAWTEDFKDVKIYEDGSVSVEGASNSNNECNCEIEHECHCTYDRDPITNRERRSEECYCCGGECDCYDEHMNSGSCPSNQGNLIQGEIQSKPLDLEHLLEWVESHYPVESNSTCGLHVHVSFDCIGDYMTCMSQKFFNYYHDSFMMWGKDNKINENSQFWSRLAGDNHFCKKVFKPELQVRAKQKYDRNDNDRYTQLNYCYGMFKTIECRMLPVFQKKELALSAIINFHSTVSSWLAKNQVKKRVKPIIIEDTEPEILKEMEIVI